jgi:hypothetical protein
VGAWDDDELADLTIGRLALCCAEENPDEVVPRRQDEAEIHELEAQHMMVRRSPDLCKRAR